MILVTSVNEAMHGLHSMGSHDQDYEAVGQIVDNLLSWMGNIVSARLILLQPLIQICMCNPISVLMMTTMMTTTATICNDKTHVHVGKCITSI